MPQITVTFVDRTGGSSSASHESFKAGITQEFVKILEDLTYSASEATIVNSRWVSHSPANGDQDLVIHWVPDRVQSHILKKWPGAQIALNASGHTYKDTDLTGSEFYRVPRLKTPLAYAKIAAHEAMHNITGLGNRTLHGQNGLAGDAAGTPHLPITDNDKALVQAGIQSGLPAQLL